MAITDRRFGPKPERRNGLCLRGHAVALFGRNQNRQCNECARIQALDYRNRNLEKVRARNRLVAKNWRRNNPDKARERSKQQRIKHRERLRDYHRKRKYGMAPETFEALMSLQGARCAICGSGDFGSRGPQIDHDHKSGVTRGILCLNCNVGLGRLEAHLDAAQAYLATSNKKVTA